MDTQENRQALWQASLSFKRLARFYLQAERRVEAILVLAKQRRTTSGFLLPLILIPTQISLFLSINTK